MPEIIYLERQDIDIAKWNNTIDGAANGLIYAYAWYLDAICDGQWAALVLGDYEVVFPLPYRKKWGIHYVYQPFFCQQLGAFGNSNASISQDVFLNAVPKKYKKIHLQLNDYFTLNQFKNQRKNYLLPLDQSYENLRQSFKQDAIKNLKKSEKLQIQFNENFDIDKALELHQKTWGKADGKLGNADYHRFARTCENARSNNRLWCVAANYNNELLGAAIFMKSNHYLHYLVSGPTDAGRKMSIMHGLINYAIKMHSDSNLTLDFEGSEIPDVAVFYEKWGAAAQRYFTFYKVRLF